MLLLFKLSSYSLYHWVNVGIKLTLTVLFVRKHLHLTQFIIWVLIENMYTISCWRNKQNHSDETLHKLLIALAHCNYDEACKLLDQHPIWFRDVFEILWICLMETLLLKNRLEFPDEIQPLNPDLEWNQRFIEYLCNDRDL